MKALKRVLQITNMPLIHLNLNTGGWILPNITSKIIQNWIKDLFDTARAKSAYPKAIKAIFEAGCLLFF